MEEIQEKLANEEISPIKRLWLQNKFAIIENKLEKQLAKLEIEKIKAEYETHKNEIYEIYNEELKIKNEELEDIFEEIEKEERIIEQKVTAVKKRQNAYKTINNTGEDKKIKNTRNTYQFDIDKNIKLTIKEQQKKLQELNDKKDVKMQEIINFKNQFVEYEKTLDTNMSKDLIKYKASVWKEIGKFFTKISNNFKEWRNNRKEEKQAIKNAKKQAKMDVRSQQQRSLHEQNRTKMDEFKERLNSEISLSDQSEYVKDIQENNKAEKSSQSLEIDETVDDTITQWKEDEIECINNTVNKSTIENILINGENIRKQKIQEDEQK